MKEAGLTVGGFSKHFNSRDALVAEAVGCALELWKRQVDAAASGGPPATYESLVDEYSPYRKRLGRKLSSSGELRGRGVSDQG